MAAQQDAPRIEHAPQAARGRMDEKAGIVMNPFTAWALWFGTIYLGAARACTDWADLIEGGEETE